MEPLTLSSLNILSVNSSHLLENPTYLTGFIQLEQALVVEGILTNNLEKEELSWPGTHVVLVDILSPKTKDDELIKA